MRLENITVDFKITSGKIFRKFCGILFFRFSIREYCVRFKLKFIRVNMADFLFQIFHTGISIRKSCGELRNISIIHVILPCSFREGP